MATGLVVWSPPLIYGINPAAEIKTFRDGMHDAENIARYGVIVG